MDPIPQAGTTSAFLEVTRGGPDLSQPPDTPPGEHWRYGLVLPFQAAPRLAAAFVNIRIRDGVLALDAGGDDFEVGVDVALFDGIAGFRAEPRLALTRNHEEANPRSQPPGARAVMVKYPARGGFVPAGARGAGGRPHPHAGSGFALNQAIARRIGPSGSLHHGVSQFPPEETHSYFEVHQLAFDGRTFRATSERVPPAGLLPGWTTAGEGLTNAIPDGDGFLVAMSAGRAGAVPTAGVMHWRKDAGRWRAVDFHPVPGTEGANEASVVRDAGGSLLLTARADKEPEFHDIRVWRSADGGRSWEKTIHVRGAISASPVTINQTADGIPYVAANLYQVPFQRLAGRFRVPRDRQGRVRAGGWDRQVLCLWPLSPDRRSLEPAIVARDCNADFGPPPGGSMWRVDHPSGAVLQLADGAWHNVLGYRVHEDVEARSILPPPQTGAYLEEVRSAGKAIPVWRF